MEEEIFHDLEPTITVIKVATGNLKHRACFLDNGDAYLASSPSLAQVRDIRAGRY